MSRLFDLSRPTLLFSNDRFKSPNSCVLHWPNWFALQEIRGCVRLVFLFLFSFSRGEGKVDAQVGRDTTACESPTQPTMLKDPDGLGVFSAWTKHAGHRPVSSRQRQSRKPRGDEFGILEDDRCLTKESSSAAISCTSWCSPATLLPPPRLQISLTILTQADWCAVRASRDPECFGTGRSLGRSAWLAAIQRTKQVCVRGGRSSGYLPHSSAAVSLNPDIRPWCVSACHLCRGNEGSAGRQMHCVASTPSPTPRYDSELDRSPDALIRRDEDRPFLPRFLLQENIFARTAREFPVQIRLASPTRDRGVRELAAFPR